jgi:hypothetical protein
MEAQWYLFPLQLAAMLCAYFGSRKWGILMMVMTLCLSLVCFKLHATDQLAIVL